VLLALHAAFAVDSLRRHCVTVDEGGHLLSGLLAWEQRRFDYYYVNPPLIKMLTSLPMAASGTRLPDSIRSTLTEDWTLQNHQFTEANRGKYQGFILRCRLVNVALSVLGGWLLYRWGSRLFGPGAGLVAVALWSLCATVVGWAGVCTVDLGTSVVGTAAMYSLWSYLRRPDRLGAVFAGWLLGLALLSKFTMLVLAPIVVLMWPMARRRRPGSSDVSEDRPRWAHLATVLAMCLLVVNLGYNLEGTCRPLGALSFRSRLVTRWVDSPTIRGSWATRCPIPIPEAFLRGLDHQISVSEPDGWMFVRGHWVHEMWWPYYLYTMALKLPLGTLLLTGMALGLACWSRRYRARRIDEALIWLPMIAIVTLLTFSMRNQFASVRYVLPAFPFLFLGISRVGIVPETGWNSRTGGGRGPAPVLAGSVLILGAIAWDGIALARVHPHELSYFNEIAGGPDRGWKHLTESNIDWGQDLLFLKDWVDRHPEARPLGLAYYGDIDPQSIGLASRSIPRADAVRAAGLPPGWYALSAYLLAGEPGGTNPIDQNDYSYFHNFEPTAKSGYSIFIYRITAADADRIRARLGRPPRPSAPLGGGPGSRRP
jgi:hypothetical protein